jgi:hypothetical protein
LFAELCDIVLSAKARLAVPESWLPFPFVKEQMLTLVLKSSSPTIASLPPSVNQALVVRNSLRHHQQSQHQESVFGSADTIRSVAPNEQAPSVPATTFTCFNRLPVELRRAIWQQACPQDRIIDFTIWAPNPIDLLIRTTTGYYTEELTLTERNPPGDEARYTHRLSREVFFENYSKAFGIGRWDMGHIRAILPTMWYNPKKDIVYLDMPHNTYLHKLHLLSLRNRRATP